MPTYTYEVEAESKAEALAIIHDLMTERLESQLKDLETVLEEKPVALDDAQVEAKILELAKLHKPLCEGTPWKGEFQAGGHYDREFAQDFDVDLDRGTVAEDEWSLEDGDYGSNEWTVVICQGCNHELWPDPPPGVLPEAPRVWDTTNTSA